MVFDGNVISSSLGRVEVEAVPKLGDDGEDSAFA